MRDSLGVTTAYEQEGTHIIRNTLDIARTRTKRDAYVDITTSAINFTGKHRIIYHV